MLCLFINIFKKNVLNIIYIFNILLNVLYKIFIIYLLLYTKNILFYFKL